MSSLPNQNCPVLCLICSNEISREVASGDNVVPINNEDSAVDSDSASTAFAEPGPSTSSSLTPSIDSILVTIRNVRTGTNDLGKFKEAFSYFCKFYGRGVYGNEGGNRIDDNVEKALELLDSGDHHPCCGPCYTSLAEMLNFEKERKKYEKAMVEAEKSRDQYAKEIFTRLTSEPSKSTPMNSYKKSSSSTLLRFILRNEIRKSPEGDGAEVPRARAAGSSTQPLEQENVAAKTNYGGGEAFSVQRPKAQEPDSGTSSSSSSCEISGSGSTVSDRRPLSGETEPQDGRNSVPISLSGSTPPVERQTDNASKQEDVLENGPSTLADPLHHGHSSSSSSSNDNNVAEDSEVQPLATADRNGKNQTQPSSNSTDNDSQQESREREPLSDLVSIGNGNEPRKRPENDPAPSREQPKRQCKDRAEKYGYSYLDDENILDWLYDENESSSSTNTAAVSSDSKASKGNGGRGRGRPKKSLKSLNPMKAVSATGRINKRKPRSSSQNSKIPFQPPRPSTSQRFDEPKLGTITNEPGALPMSNPAPVEVTFDERKRKAEEGEAFWCNKCDAEIPIGKQVYMCCLPSCMEPFTELGDDDQNWVSVGYDLCCKCYGEVPEAEFENVGHKHEFEVVLLGSAKKP